MMAGHSKTGSTRVTNDSVQMENVLEDHAGQEVSQECSERTQRSVT